MTMTQNASPARDRDGGRQAVMNQNPTKEGK